jgi:hypothetical protein
MNLNSSKLLLLCARNLPGNPYIGMAKYFLSGCKHSIIA